MHHVHISPSHTNTGAGYFFYKEPTRTTVSEHAFQQREESTAGWSERLFPSVTLDPFKSSSSAAMYLLTVPAAFFNPHQTLGSDRTGRLVGIPASVHALTHHVTHDSATDRRFPDLSLFAWHCYGKQPPQDHRNRSQIPFELPKKKKTWNFGVLRCHAPTTQTWIYQIIQVRSLFFPQTYEQLIGQSIIVVTSQWRLLFCFFWKKSPFDLPPKNMD